MFAYPIEGNCYLYMKTIERAHTPAKMWEVIPLGDNFKQALETIDHHLEYWSEGMVHRVKQRLTKIWQYLIRMRKLRNALRPKIVGINKKVERREVTREREALAAAQVEKQIKKELLERLSQNTYGEIYNFAPAAFEEIMDEQTQPDEFYEEEYVEGEYDDMPGDLEDLPGDSEEEDGEDAWDEDNMMAGLSGDDSEEEPIFGEDEDTSKKSGKRSKPAEDDEEGSSDDERLQPPKTKKPKLSSSARATSKKPTTKRRPHLEIEMETEPAQTSRHRN
jgi:protein MAK16